MGLSLKRSQERLWTIAFIKAVGYFSRKTKKTGIDKSVSPIAVVEKTSIFLNSGKRETFMTW